MYTYTPLYIHIYIYIYTCIFKWWHHITFGWPKNGLMAWDICSWSHANWIIFIPTSKNVSIWLAHIFQMGWFSHQLDIIWYKYMVTLVPQNIDDCEFPPIRSDIGQLPSAWVYHWSRQSTWRTWRVCWCHRWGGDAWLTWETNSYPNFSPVMALECLLISNHMDICKKNCP